jgi:peroxiredoxin/ribosomal protein S18 acetylase RimI-like enzyme
MKASAPSAVIRSLREDDAAAFRELRLRALRENPDAFLATAEEEEKRSEKDFAAPLRRSADGTGVLGAFLGKTLIGILGVHRHAAAKARHRASLWGMYVAPDKRRHGVGRALLDDALDRLRAAGDIEQIELMVVTRDEAARALYLSAGFQIQGVSRRAFKVGRSYFDEEALVLWLEGPASYAAPSHPLPAGLPAPVDDGAAAHLVGLALPDVALPSTASGGLRLSSLAGRTVIFVHSRIAGPSEKLDEAWARIPGATGCTSEACAFRDHVAALDAAGARVVGLSAQPSAELAEAAKRLRLPFPMLSDKGFRLAQTLRLPTFEHEGKTYLRRLTLVVDDGKIVHVFYPVFPPDRHPGEVYGWLQANQR